MRSCRVIRPARLAPHPFQVLVPENVPSGPDPGPGRELDSRLSAEEREQELRLALEDLEQRLADKEEAHLRQLREVEARMAEESRREVAEAVAAFSTILDDFRAQQNDLLKSSEETVVRLALAVARRIVGDAVRVDSDIVLETVRQALKHVQEKENLTIRVNPEDLKIVREHRSEWLSMMEGTGSLEVIEDERIRRGGCLVETEAGNVEAQIEKQLQTLEKVLVEAVR